jgi:hypothetical protein
METPNTNAETTNEESTSQDALTIPILINELNVGSQKKIARLYSDVCKKLFEAEDEDEREKIYKNKAKREANSDDERNELIGHFMAISRKIKTLKEE